MPYLRPFILCLSGCSLFAGPAMAIERLGNSPGPVVRVQGEELRKPPTELPRSLLFRAPVAREPGTTGIWLRGVGAATYSSSSVTGGRATGQFLGDVAYGLPLGDGILSLGANIDARVTSSSSNLNARPFASYTLGNSTFSVGGIENAAYAIKPVRNLDLFNPTLPGTVFGDQVRYDHRFRDLTLSASVSLDGTYGNLGAGYDLNPKTYLYGGVEYNFPAANVTYTNLGIVHDLNDRTVVALDWTKRGAFTSTRLDLGYLLSDGGETPGSYEPDSFWPTSFSGPSSWFDGMGQTSLQFMAESNSSGRRGIGAGIAWTPTRGFDIGLGVEMIAPTAGSALGDDLVAVFRVQRTF